jgi:hypothetical protein
MRDYFTCGCLKSLHFLTISRQSLTIKSHEKKFGLTLVATGPEKGAEDTLLL